jgi:allantoinase
VNDTQPLIIRADRVVLPDGIRPAAIHVRAGRITAITPGTERARVPEAGQAERLREIDAGPLTISPGLVDSHVHVNDPGREDWEGFEHATRSAAAGGVTTLVDMPLNSIPATTSVAALDAKRRAAAGRCHVDVGFWGGVVPGNSGELQPLARAGVLGFKCFLCPSGVDEFAHVTERDLREALPVLATLGLPLLVHAELPSHLLDPHGGSRRYATWLDSRPPAAEHAAIDLLIRLAREFQVHVHVVHLASAEAIPALVAARADGVPITVETCPHYLTFAADEIRDGATAFKCAPPIRARRHRDDLWKGLADGAIDLVVTDHSPSPPDLKHLDDGDFVQAWGGIASLQIGLAVVWTGAKAHGMTVDRLAPWLSTSPAKLAGLDRMKGRIAVGCDGDFVIWDPDGEIQIDAASLHHRHHVTPYDGMSLYGRVHTTILRGEVVFDAGEIKGPAQGREPRWSGT